MKKIFVIATVFALIVTTFIGFQPALANGNLVVNGGFEEPVVTDPAKWDIFPDGTADLGWTVEWYGGSTSYGGYTRPDPSLQELHQGVMGWLPYEGEQYAELDTDWYGPGHPQSGEPASVKIYQDIETCEGGIYELEYAWSPRPGHSDNGLKVYWGGVEIANHSGSGGSNTSWTLETHSDLLPIDGSTTLAFVETGNPDSLGMFLDNVSVLQTTECYPEEPEILTCPEGTIQTHLETVTVLSDGSTVPSANVLKSGIKYILEASGTYTYWPAQLPDAGIADAKYSLRPEGNNNPGPGPRWISGDDLASPWTNYLEVLMDSGPVSWGAFNLAHEYYLLLDGTNSTVGFKILDSYYPDNSGSLEVDIYKCVLVGGDTEVSNDNSAIVNNNVTVVASTGDNTATGGSGNNGGSSGSTVAVGGSNATGGDGGWGGGNALVVTGNATANTVVFNLTNTNITRINSRGNCCYGDVDVDNDNHARIKNRVKVEAETGDNDAEGGSGNDGGDAGSTVAVNGSNATGGWAGDGGGNAQIQTGHAYSSANVRNIVNTNTTRVRR